MENINFASCWPKQSAMRFFITGSEDKNLCTSYMYGFIPEKDIFGRQVSQQHKFCLNSAPKLKKNDFLIIFM